MKLGLIEQNPISVDINGGCTLSYKQRLFHEWFYSDIFGSMYKLRFNYQKNIITKLHNNPK